MTRGGAQPIADTEEIEYSGAKVRAVHHLTKAEDLLRKSRNTAQGAQKHLDAERHAQIAQGWASVALAMATRDAR